MKITVEQLKKLIREQVEEAKNASNQADVAAQVLENSGFSGEVSEDGEITIFINYDIFDKNGYTLTERGTRPASRELYLTFSPKEWF